MRLDSSCTLQTVCDSTVLCDIFQELVLNAFVAVMNEEEKFYNLILLGEGTVLCESRNCDMKSAWPLQRCECKAPRLYQLWIIDWSGVKCTSKTSQNIFEFVLVLRVWFLLTREHQLFIVYLLTFVSHPIQ